MREHIITSEAIDLSSALVLGSHKSARTEARTGVKETAEDFGAGATRFRVTRVPGATGVKLTKQTGLPPSASYPVTVIFATGRCMLALGLSAKSAVTPATAQQEAGTAA